MEGADKSTELWRYPKGVHLLKNDLIMFIKAGAQSLSHINVFLMSHYRSLFPLFAVLTILQQIHVTN